MSAMQMTNGSSSSAFQPNTRLLALGVAMTSVGVLAGATGAAIFGLSLAMAGRRWVQSWETPPAERAHRTFTQARMASQAASQAGLDAWRGSSPSVN